MPRSVLGFVENGDQIDGPQPESPELDTINRNPCWSMLVNELLAGHRVQREDRFWREHMVFAKSVEFRFSTGLNHTLENSL